MQQIRKWSAPLLAGLWALVLLHAAIPHVHTGREAADCCAHDHVMELEWVDSLWGWMHDWVHHHEESTVCDNLEDNYVASPQLQIFDLPASRPSSPLFPPVEQTVQDFEANVLLLVWVDPGLDRRNGKRGP